MICLELKTWLSCTIFLAWKFNNSFYGLMEREKEREAKKELENENRVCLNPGKRDASKFPYGKPPFLHRLSSNPGKMGTSAFPQAKPDLKMQVCFNPVFFNASPFP